jgi:DNA-binding transcriptional regulator LsrR (DeoR family)
MADRLIRITTALEQEVRARHQAGSSQRAISRELGIGRRKIKRIIEQAE